MQFSTITSWARLIWDALATYGIDSDAAFREVGLDPAALDDPKGRYPVVSVQRLWRLAAERSGDPCFGLTAAAQWHPTTWHGLGYAWLASATLEEAFRRLVRYSGIISNAVAVSLEETAVDLRVVATAGSGAPAIPLPVAVDALAANIVHMCRLAAGPEFNLRALELGHDGPGCRRRRAELFRAPIRYGAPATVLVVDRADAVRHLPRANAELAHANERVIADYLMELRGGETRARVRERLIEELPSGEATAARIAALLCMSPRTLQRRLHAEGTSFSDELDRTRAELAERFIRDRSLTFGEITFLLGFSEVSSFSRSFKRWTGLAPTAFRSRVEAG